MIKTFITFFFVSAICFNSTGQSSDSVSHNQKEQIIVTIQSLISAHYVFPEKIDSINTQLSHLAKSETYKLIHDYNELAIQLTSDIRSISDDLHFLVRYDPSTRYEDKTIKKKRQNYERFANYGFSTVQILEGNIGYIKLDFFSTPNKNILKTVFEFVKNTNGIIIDLRDNNGGTNKMTQLLLSYFVKRKTEIGRIVYANEKSKKIKTYRRIKEGRMDEVPMAILVSKNTFSAAESFSYTLKHLKRATIIGDSTGGGAHSVKFLPVNDSIYIGVPYANIINPITKSNWEGIGVIPDIKSEYETSVLTGHIHILKALHKEAKTIETKEFYQKIINKKSP